MNAREKQFSVTRAAPIDRRRGKKQIPVGSSISRPLILFPALFLAMLPSYAANTFGISNGQIITPSGQVFRASGINCNAHQVGVVSTNADGAPLTTLFPGLNFIRVACGRYPAASSFQTFVSQLTARGIVVELEHHPWPLIAPLAGSALTEESHWYAGLASAFANNPYVWFGSMNEPQGAYGAAEAAVSFQQLATYNAIRAAGNSNIIMFECGVGSGNPGTIGARFGMTASTYATMTNIVWDLHQYNWMNHNSTNQAMADANLLGAASTGRGFRAAQTITSADGLVPVLVGETGLYSGSTNETGGEQILAADFGATYTAGTAVWHWYPSNWDNLTDNAGHLNAYGQLIAGYITRAASTDRPRGQNGTVHH